jgi:hypothetical protein
VENKNLRKSTTSRTWAHVRRGKVNFFSSSRNQYSS